MSAPLMARARGFSLPEVLIALLLMMLVVTALSGYQRALYTGLNGWRESRQIGRYGRGQALAVPGPLPEGWRQHREQVTSSGGQCFITTITLTSPRGRQGRFRTLHCQ